MQQLQLTLSPEQLAALAAAAQRQLDQWASLVFATGSPSDKLVKAQRDLLTSSISKINKALK